MDEPIPQDDLVMIEPEDCDAWQMPEGLLLIGRLDSFVAQGFLDILPGRALPTRSRPVAGVLKQMAGTVLVRLFEGSRAKETTLRTGDTLPMPAGMEYAIENPSQEKCVVYWRFDGDVTQQLEQLKASLPRLPFQAREKSGYKELFEAYQKRRQDEDTKVLGKY